MAFTYPPSLWERYRYTGFHHKTERKARFWIIIPMVAVAALFTMSTPASAKSNAPVVMVEEHIHGRYDVLLRRAAKYTDRFTMSRMVFGKCVPDKRCIIVRVNPSLGIGMGRTQCLNPRVCRTTTITFNGNTHRGSTAYWTRLFEHELGHAYGLGHSKYHTNIMYGPILYHGKVVKERYTSYQQSILRQY